MKKPLSQILSPITSFADTYSTPEKLRLSNKNMLSLSRDLIKLLERPQIPLLLDSELKSKNSSRLLSCYWEKLQAEILSLSQIFKDHSYLISSSSKVCWREIFLILIMLLPSIPRSISMMDYISWFKDCINQLLNQVSEK